MSTDNVAIRTLSICTGGAGIELGLELACLGIFVPIAYCECEAYAASLLTTRMEEKALPQAPIWSDVRSLCDAGFSDYVRARGGLDFICGGYPCQDFSTAGKRAGMEGVRGSLWFSIAEAIRKYQPSMCFFENVSGHLNLGFDTVLSDLRAMGYEVAAGLFTASEVGASHKRERLFILANSGYEHQHIQQWADGTEPTGSSNVMANACCGRYETERGERRKLQGTRGELADASRPGYDRQDRQAERSGRRGVCQDGAELADTASSRMEGIGAGRFQESQAQVGQEISGCDSLPVFPPGPGDIESWRKVLEIGPALEPAICRMADGMALRVERLRMLGNGVVPLQAAYAFVSLLSCLREARINGR